MSVCVGFMAAGAMETSAGREMTGIEIGMAMIASAGAAGATAGTADVLMAPGTVSGAGGLISMILRFRKKMRGGPSLVSSLFADTLAVFLVMLRL